MIERPGRLLLVCVVLAVASSCSSGGADSATPSTAALRSSRTTSTTATAPSTPGTAPVASGDPCGSSAAPPARYDHVVVFSFENRTWDAVGGEGFKDMPYMSSLAEHCATLTDLAESDTGQNSATQYVSQFQGNTNHTARNDCTPSPGCRSTADNLFRQARAARLGAVNYVEGATTPCSAEGNAAKHVPALYFQGADDSASCSQQVQPSTQFDPEKLPAFSFITPNMCNDGHDCDNAKVDAWARANIGAVLDSQSYRAGRTLVQVWYDEDHPKPNLYVAPTAKAGAGATPVTYRSDLRLWEDLLGLPCLSGACGATDLRPLTGV